MKGGPSEKEIAISKSNIGRNARFSCRDYSVKAVQQKEVAKGLLDMACYDLMGRIAG
jgi:hypothetical protein